jgi:hypothetical protein
VKFLFRILLISATTVSFGAADSHAQTVLPDPTPAQLATCQAGGSVFEVHIGAVSTRTSTASGTPLSGMRPGIWANTARPGHGWAIYQTLKAPDLAPHFLLGWYTYDQSGFPVWYTTDLVPTSDPLPSKVTANLLRYEWVSGQNGPGYSSLMRKSFA